ncbi:FkbM family methyltransferase [Arthrobacter rhizosphaerae]|uniref:FkbM family methyltransferase n=1 Tax=Arthrobacter rhizosphaerae TaxID=2855490 RepID=UPI001FF3E5E2|nr:FkbM family methyltransferase [Arthrobacter rhizosphaerae]
MKPIEVLAAGKSYFLDLPEADVDYIQKSIANTKRPYEEEMLIDIAKSLAPGDLVLDVGANCGNHTLYLSCIIGVEVHAFEPDGDLCSSIRSSAAINGVEHLVTIHDVAVGDAEGFGRLVQTAEHNRGAQRLHRVADDDSEMRIVRLDDLNFHKSVQVMKIDVEGMELEVLNGARNLVDKDHPEIYIECQTRHDFELIHSWLMEFGYQYQRTFNATPTHHFSARASVSSGDRFEQIVRQQVSAAYYDQQLIARLRESLSEANAKYRGVSAQLRPISEQLRLTAASESRHLERLQQLERALQDKEGRVEELVRIVEAGDSQSKELKIRLAASVRANDKLKAQAESTVAALSDTRSSLSVEQRRAQGLERLVEQANALSVELESQFSSETQRWIQHREEYDQQLAHAARQHSRLRRKMKLYSSRTRQALVQRDEYADRLSTVESALADIEVELKEADRRLTIEKGLTSRLDKVRVESEVELRAAKTTTREAQAKIAQLESALDGARQQLVNAELRTKSLRQSVTYRLGLVVKDSLKSPINLLRLPLNLYTLMSQHRLRNRASSSITFPEEQELAPLPEAERTPLNRAPEIRDSRLLANSGKTAALQLGPKDEKKAFRVAAIMDDFTVQAFAPECDLQELSIDNYLVELETFSPDVVFLESAWRGKGGAWGNRVAQTAAEVREIIAWANQNNVPTVLWNKEDPVHYSTFLNTAKHVDHVFTTDIDCIQRYKDDLGHNRVHFLPFACQPLLHNPLELYKRSPSLCFAGAYYRRYPDRTRDLESFLAAIPQYAPLDIFDRNFGKSDEQYKFPDEYQSYIVGTLSSAEIDLAYKGYDYAVNLNSVKESQSMFARRVYELFASNTTIISNYSRGLQLMFGELPLLGDSGKVIVRQLNSSTGTFSGRKRRLAGLRKVMLEHTYQHRLEFILDQVAIPHATLQRPVVEVFSLVSTESELHAVLESVRRQIGVDVIHRIYSEDMSWFDKCTLHTDVAVAPISSLAEATLNDLVQVGNAAGVMVAKDYYGEHYLLDLALAGRYSSASVVGKSSFFELARGTIAVKETERPYTAVNNLPIRSSLVLRPMAIRLVPREWLRKAEEGTYEGDSLLGTELFDYCRNGSGLGDTDRLAVGSGVYDTGIGLDELTTVAAQIRAVDFAPEVGRVTSGGELAELFVTMSRPGVHTEVTAEGWSFKSTLDDGVHDYLYSTKLLDLENLAVDDHLEFHIEADPGLNLQMAIIFYGDTSEKISGTVRGSNQNQTLIVPAGASRIKVGIRIHSSGEAMLRRVLWKHKNLKPAFIAARAANLVVTNRYPAYGDLYKNAFVHSRVLKYIQSGVHTEVFVLDESSPLRFREFEGVAVLTGSSDALETFLRDNEHTSISLHFVNETMWNMVRNLPRRPRLAIWAHGADIQKWTRRAFLYETDDEIEEAKKSSDARLAVWTSIFSDLTPEMTVVFVSEWLARTALEDLGMPDERNNVAVIHNPINTQKFAYQRKSSNQRLKVLSIRPYASSVYANDLVVEAIHILSKEPDFHDMEFRLVGDGHLFEELTKSLRNFSNVTLDQRFLTQDEIAEMHREYGIFLCPSRMDTHGVSRDEAMASGLVPVTSSTAAIPEFVDETCAELVEPESASAIAAAVARLARSKALFRGKSQAASARVRKQSAASTVIPQELALLGHSGFAEEK